MKFNLGDKVKIKSNGVIGIIISRGYNEYLDENDKQQSFEEYQIEADKYYQCNEDEIELCNPIIEVTKDTMNKIYDGILNIKPISDNRVKYEIDNNGNMFKLGDSIKEMKCGNCREFDKTTGICKYNNIAVCRDSGGVCEGYYPSVQEIEVEDKKNCKDCDYFVKSSLGNYCDFYGILLNIMRGCNEFQLKKHKEGIKDIKTETIENDPVNPFMEEYERIVTDTMELCKKKNKDYGSSVQDTYERFGDISYLTRITDKYNRICSLMTKENKVKDESVIDSIKDMGNYCFLWATSKSLEEKGE